MIILLLFQINAAKL